MKNYVEGFWDGFNSGKSWHAFKDEHILGVKVIAEEPFTGPKVQEPGADFWVTYLVLAPLILVGIYLWMRS